MKKSMSMKLIMVLISIALLSNCQKAEMPIELNCLPHSSENITITTTLLNIPNTQIILSEEKTIASSLDNSIKKYEYSPPQEVLKTHFYIDDIETKIMLQDASSEDFNILNIFSNPEVEKAMYKAFAKNLPTEIVDDMTQNIQFPDWLSDFDLKITSMGYMKFDFNSDGREDYYVVANLNDKSEVECKLYTQTFYSFDRIYISEDSSFVPITIPSFDDTQNGVHSILSTETNGLKDLLAFCNSNAPTLKYDGVSAYGGFTESDERHTFTDCEILQNNTLHFNMQVSSIDAPLGEYYTAIKVADNPYIKNNLLYTCYPDGVPRTYTQKPFGESLPTDFAPSIEGYDFYVELTDEGTKHDDISLDILEIKYVAVDNDSR